MNDNEVLLLRSKRKANIDIANNAKYSQEDRLVAQVRADLLEELINELA